MRSNLKFGSQENVSSGNVSTEPDELNLLVAWSNPLAVFAGNVADYLRRRVVPAQATTSEPDETFWRDVDLRTPWPRRGMVDSVCAHAALLGLLYAVSIWPAEHLASPETSPTRSSLHYAYPVSSYLPELRGETARSAGVNSHTTLRASLLAKPATRSGERRMPDPEPARQEIRSLPQAPDNLHQTIVAPPRVRLQQDVSLPNIVAYQPAAPIQPLAASERPIAKLRMPDLRPSVTGPVADTSALHPRSRIPALNSRVVEPAPDLAQLSARIVVPSLQAKVAGPSPDVDSVGRGRQMPPHMGNASGAPAERNSQNGDSWTNNSQIIALSLHPAEVHGPVELPTGNRSGSFAASPEGNAGASGAAGSESPAVRSALPPNAPAGIDVAAPVLLNTAATGPGSGSAPNASPVGAADPRQENTVAAMHPPAFSIPTRLPPEHSPEQPIAHETTEPRSELENRIFAGRRSYTLLVNMPNLNTVTGSWIIHFVERKPLSGAAPVAAPQVVSKSDPAYPGELVRDGVHGTVILTATIRADGSVGDIAVAQSLDPQLDRNAAEALSRWIFRPAVRDGQAIDLEAVISVPFRAKAGGY